MRKSAITIFVAGVLLVLAMFTYAQRPPDAADGVPFLKVNINPTNVPPEININPNRTVPRVEVAQMPEIRFTPSGCSNGRNFRTAIGTTISGPLMVTFLNTSQQNAVRLIDNQNGNQRVDLSPDTKVATALFLGAGQTLQFDSSVMYSGCQPD